jgi:hypothetical protein
MRAVNFAVLLRLILTPKAARRQRVNPGRTRVPAPAWAAEPDGWIEYVA